MNLSSDLISQFVKVTKDETKTRGESTVYGTVVSYSKSESDSDPEERVIYVHLDGTDEDLLTPVVPTSADTVVGERVAVLIKNHTATITGNLDSPAARNKDVEMKANSDDVIEADTVIANNLLAETARINELVSDNVIIKNTLTATNAEISNLKTNKLDATYADIINANVEDLKSVKATIGDLEADVADIDTLIFGSATGTTIQTSFANAVIAQLGDAQIKSAMIKSISADKIVTGDIITNDVRILSDDGKLLISDETIQIRDNTRVRVQIGKDASDDYSINIWDQNGNLMFSKGGITDNAIKEAIIRNDMVSDTANIHASKLDIDSLFEEINDSTNTIKSTKVYLDDKNQTLDVAFKSLSDTVTTQGSTISSQGTTISAIQGQINSKIWQQDIDTAKGEMSTQYSTILQELGSFKTTVSETYATKSLLTNVESSITQMSDRITENVSKTTNLGTRMNTFELTASGLTTRLTAVESLDIGGRNLIANTAFGPANRHRIYSSSGTLTRTAEGLKLVCGAGTYKNGFLLPLVADGCLQNGQKYTLSFQYRTNITATGTVYVMQRTTPNVNISGGMDLIASESEWQTLTLTFSSNSINDRICYSILIPYMTGEGNWIEIRDRTIKLEKGETVTEWSAAHEDASFAAKTATDYMNFSTSGLVIGDMTTSTLGKNILIDSDSVDIRSGETVRASFGEDYLYLAKHSRNATIDLCNGLAKLYHKSRLSYDTLFVIETPNATEIRGTSDPLCITSTVASKPAIKFANSDGVLGSIGMVASGTESYITRNHPSTSATYSILDTGNYYKLMDSGWINCTLNTGSFTRYNNDIPQPQVRKIGKQVYLRGEATPVTAVTPETDSDTVIATIPSGYRPAQRKQFIMQGSGSYRWMMSIHTDGRIAISRYSNTTTANMNIAAGAWLCCHAQWLID